MKDTIVIAYPAGAYGTYVNWVLDRLMGTCDLENPQGPKGSSHGYIGIHLQSMAGWKEYLANDATYNIVRLHPKIFENESLIKNIKILEDEGHKVLHVYPDRSSYLLIVHNYLYKTSLSSPWDVIFQSINKEDLYNNWPVVPGTPLEELAAWIQREFFSLNLFTSWESQVEWYLPDVLPETNSHKYLFVNDLLWNFENSISQVEQQLGVEFQRPISEIIQYHNDNLSRQKYVGQQKLAESIISAVIDHRYMSWENKDLTIFTESWIQKKLRDRGLGLACNGLNEFPTDSYKLANLLSPL